MMRDNTPMQQRCNEEYDTLRVIWAKMHADKAELCRSEFLQVMVLVRLEHQRWMAVRRARLPIMPEGRTFEALSVPPETVRALVEALREDRTVDLKDLLR